VNVANLFLVRSEARQREVAVRRALGAGRLGIARFFLAESVPLCIAAGAVGLLLAWAAVRLLVAYGPASLPRLEEVRLDGLTVAFTFMVTMLAALSFGSIPLWRGAVETVALHEIGRGNTTSRRSYRTRQLLIGAQVSLALVLLISSGLIVRSFQNLRMLDPGFNPTSALTFRIGLPGRDYPSRSTAVAAHRAILDRLSAVPGIEAVSATTCLPLSHDTPCFGNVLQVSGRPTRDDTVPRPAAFAAVAGWYIETMGMRVLRGRSIDRRDVERGEPVAVVNQALVDAYFPDQDPVGAHIASAVGLIEDQNAPVNVTWLTIVGVVANTPVYVLAETTPLPMLYIPMSIAGGPDLPPLTGPTVTVMSYVARSTSSPRGLLRFVREAVNAVDPNLALASVRTLEDTLDRAAAQMAFTMILLVIAAGVALTLSVIGIFGVTSYIVSQRTGEIGVRLALGAEPWSIATMIVRQNGFVAIAGLAVGLAMALAAGRVIESLLYGVSPRDPVVFAGTTVTVLAVALLACWLPARRAAGLNPIEALREN
jgi:putative ABC transport system permease protein